VLAAARIHVGLIYSIVKEFVVADWWLVVVVVAALKFVFVVVKI